MKDPSRFLIERKNFKNVLPLPSAVDQAMKETGTGSLNKTEEATVLLMGSADEYFFEGL
jgi:hypothetical protein